MKKRVSHTPFARESKRDIGKPKAHSKSKAHSISLLLVVICLLEGGLQANTHELYWSIEQKHR